MMNWARITVVKDGVKMFMSDDMKRTTEMIVLDFEKEVPTADLMTAIAMSCRPTDFRYFSVNNVAEMRVELFGDGKKTGALPEGGGGDDGGGDDDQEQICLIDCIGFRDWLAWPLVRILDKLIDWCGVKA